MNTTPQTNAPAKTATKIAAKRRQGFSGCLLSASDISELKIDELNRGTLADLEHAEGGDQCECGREDRSRQESPLEQLVCGRHRDTDQRRNAKQLPFGERAGYAEDS